MTKSRLILLLIGVTGLAYCRSLTGDFIYDDKAIIVKNPLVRRPISLTQIFGSPYWGKSAPDSVVPSGGLYRPLPILSYAVNYHLGGLRPWTFHMVNLALHIGVSLLLLYLLVQLGFSAFMSWMAALLFALLPVHVEAVSSVVGRAELLSAFFVLSAWILLLPSKRPKLTLLGAIAFVLALLSKENAIAFVPVLMANDVFRFKQPLRETFRERAGVWTAAVGVSLVYLLWRAHVLGQLLGVGGMSYFGETALRSMVITMSVFFWSHYMRPLILGFPLCADYTRPQLSDTAFLSPGGWLALIALVGLCVYAIHGALRRKHPVAFGTLIGLLMLFPMSNLLAPLEVIGADRFLYLPSIGYVIALAFGLSLLNTLKRSAGLICGVVLALWYGTLTWQRDGIWKTESTFWGVTVHDAPRSPRAWNGLGVTKLDGGQPEEAKDHFVRAMHLNPRLLDAHYNLAICFLLTGDRKHAKAGLEYVVSVRPEDLNALFKLARLAEEEGNKKAALSYYERMSKIDPLEEGVQQRLAKLRGIRL